MRLSVGTLRQVVKRDLAIEFAPQQLTSYGGLELLRRYLRQLELPRRLRAACAALGGDYGGARLGLLLLAVLYVGARRLCQGRTELSRKHRTKMSPVHRRSCPLTRHASAPTSSRSAGAPAGLGLRPSRPAFFFSRSR